MNGAAVLGGWVLPRQTRVLRLDSVLRLVVDRWRLSKALRLALAAWVTRGRLLLSLSFDLDARRSLPPLFRSSMLRAPWDAPHHSYTVPVAKAHPVPAFVMPMAAPPSKSCERAMAGPPDCT